MSGEPEGSLTVKATVVGRPGVIEPAGWKPASRYIFAGWITIFFEPEDEQPATSGRSRRSAAKRRIRASVGRDRRPRRKGLSPKGDCPCSRPGPRTVLWRDPGRGPSLKAEVPCDNHALNFVRALADLQDLLVPVEP